jgi:acyl-coenzyme A synthetase/AMP-(fatty) acid ligase
LVADDTLKAVAPGEAGELLMNGPQMSLGYWNDPGLTAARFVKPPGSDEVYYRTGDRVRQLSRSGPLTHLGRMDFQVKILGHRVELGEIEARVRKASGLDGVVAVGWPRTPSGFGGIEVFVEGKGDPGDALRKRLQAELPDYMVPRRVHFMERLPRNVNDKFDRQAMSALLESGL